MRKFKKRKSNNRIQKKTISIAILVVLCLFIYFYTSKPFIAIISVLAGFFISRVSNYK